MARAVVFAAAAALVVFAAVQDRLTAEGVARYLSMQREAIAADRAGVTIDAVMKPAVANSVRQGVVWAVITFAAATGVTLVVRIWHRE